MQDKLKFPFKLKIFFHEKPSVYRFKTFNCKTSNYAWGAAQRWAVRESKKHESLEWELVKKGTAPRPKQDKRDIEEQKFYAFNNLSMEDFERL